VFRCVLFKFIFVRFIQTRRVVQFQRMWGSHSGGCLQFRLLGDVMALVC
jgi:hypothetical protein